MIKLTKSIESYGGLRQYLDDPTVRELHNGYGYDDLIKNKHRSPAFIRDLFNVKTRETAIRWLKMLEEE